MKKITIIILILNVLFCSDIYSQKMRKGTTFIGTNSLDFMSKLNTSLNNTTTVTTNNQASTNSIDYNINSDDEFNLNLQLSGGYFVADNLLFGIDANIITNDVLKNYTDPSDTNYLYSLTSKETTMLFGGFLRYYLRVGSGFLFASSGFDYGIMNSEITETFLQEYSGTETNMKFGLGYSIKIASKFCIEPEIMYYMKERVMESESDAGLLNIQQETKTTESTEGIKFKLGISFYL